MRRTVGSAETAGESRVSCGVARSLVLATAIVTLGACGTDSVPLEPQPPAPPAAGTWHLTRSDGQSLPALVGHRLVMGDLEQVFADSAQLEIASDGAWVIRSWLQVYRNGFPYQHAKNLERGAWQWQDTAYVFTSEQGRSRGWMREPAAAEQTFWMRYEGVDGISVSSFRRERPSLSVHGAWHGTWVDGAHMPHVIATFDPFEEDGVLKSIHVIIDSASLVLHPTRHYTHRVWFSEWEGAVAGVPAAKRFDWHHGDRGSFAKTGTTLTTESTWLQGHRMTGTVPLSGDTLEMTHPFSHGETMSAFTYARSSEQR